MNLYKRAAASVLFSAIKNERKITMTNIPELKPGIISVSRGCFPIALSERAVMPL